MTLRVIIAAEIAWIMYRFGMFPIETFFGVLGIVAVGYVVDLIIRRDLS